MPISQEVAYWSVVEQAKAIKEGKFTSRELLELTIERIESVNPELNAVVTMDLDLARKLADEADAKLKAGAVVGPLHGIPITVKDALETAGIRSTGGATELHNHVPDRDAPGEKLINQAIEFGWSVAFPEWDKTVGDVADAVLKYGRLFTIQSILKTTESSKLKIDLKRKMYG